MNWCCLQARWPQRDGAGGASGPRGPCADELQHDLNENHHTIPAWDGSPAPSGCGSCAATRALTRRWVHVPNSILKRTMVVVVVVVHGQFSRFQSDIPRRIPFHISHNLVHQGPAVPPQAHHSGVNWIISCYRAYRWCVIYAEPPQAPCLDLEYTMTPNGWSGR